MKINSMPTVSIERKDIFLALKDWLEKQGIKPIIDWDNLPNVESEPGVYYKLPIEQSNQQPNNV